MPYKDELKSEVPVSLVFHDFSNLNIDVRNVKWLKPQEISKKPTLFGCQDLSVPVQGSLGNCWFVSVCYILSHNKETLERVFDVKKDFNESSYDGTWTFNLWNSNLNEWNKIRIDDKLPTIDRKLIFGSNVEENVFWFPLLEKACAKFYGCYEALCSGKVSEAVMLLTGGYSWQNQLGVDTDISLVKKQIMDVTEKFGKMGIVLSMDEQDGGNQLNLVPFHYYVIENIAVTSDGMQLKLWNPWNKAQHSCNTEKLMTSLLQLINDKATLTFITTSMNPILGATGNVCNLNIRGAWEAGFTCGGRKNLSSYSSNPQYIISVDDSSTRGQTCEEHIFISLIQSNKREHRKRKELQRAIGLHAWKLNSSLSRSVTYASLTTNQPDFQTSPAYQYTGVVSLFCSLPTDVRHLLVIPSTYVPAINSTFLIRTCSLTTPSVMLLRPT